MFGIGGGELVLILFIMLMLFGAEKIPEIARTMGKIMAQLKNATNDIKSEIQKSAENNGLDKTFQEMHGDFTGLSQNITTEINKAKTKLLEDSPKVETSEDIELIEGPVKRQR
jgi:sec-independent protein translocase protein TatA